MVKVGEITNGNGNGSGGSGTSNGSGGGGGGWRGSSPTEMFSEDIVSLDKKRHQKSKSRWWKPLAVLCSLLALLLIGAVVVLAFLLGFRNVQDDPPASHDVSSASVVRIFDETHPTESVAVPSTEGKTPEVHWALPSGSMYTQFKKATIASDNGLCSEIGRDVLFEGGNAVDATIASLLCIGVVNPQSSGLGGGFVMTIYNRTTGRCVTVDARETAPLAATETMYVNDTKQSSEGYRSVATPAELHGFWTAFTRFGSGVVPWRRLVAPAARLAAKGFPVSNNLAEVLLKKEKEIMADEHMKKEFVDPATGRVYEEGDLLKRENLALTLDLIANDTDPVGLFYRHGMAQSIAAEFHMHGGLVTAADLAAYQTLVEESPLVVEDLPGGLTMCGPPPPSSFVIMQSIVRTMAKWYDGTSKVDLNDPLVYHRYIEVQKFAYAQRMKLGDWKFVETARDLVETMMTPEYIETVMKAVTNESQPMDAYTDVIKSVPEDHGTSHVSAIDEHGNAVSCTSTVNLLLGSLRISPTLGIIWNDEMDDFSTPGTVNSFGFAPSETNFIRPGKKPMSSMAPTVLYNPADGEVKMVAGAAGGSFIISSVANTIIHTLLFNRTVKEAIDSPRFHNQFMPFRTDYEYFAPKEIVKSLIKTYKQNMTEVQKIPSVVHALELMADGYIHGNSDFRRKTATYPSGF